LHTIVLDDPFETPQELKIPTRSPSPVKKGQTERLEYDEKVQQDNEDLIKQAKRLEAKKRAVVLEILNDIPDADVKPPDNVLFICKLNPVTQEQDLELIFSRFGLIKNVDIVRD